MSHKLKWKLNFLDRVNLVNGKNLLSKLQVSHNQVRIVKNVSNNDIVILEDMLAYMKGVIVIYLALPVCIDERSS